MKHRTLIALALAGALAIPAMAQKGTSEPPQATPAATDQQQNTSSQTQATPANQQSSQTQTSKDNAETATQKQPLQYERHEGFWGHMMPFARKKYVQRQLNPVRGRVNELDELTAANSRVPGPPADSTISPERISADRGQLGAGNPGRKRRHLHSVRLLDRQCRFGSKGN